VAASALTLVTQAGLAACGQAATPSGTAGTPAAGVSHAPAVPAGVPRVPRPRHTVVVIMENHSYSEIIGNPQARFVNGLARQGALFTASHAVSHPSEPNYLALFSGSTHGVTSDQCPTRFLAPNLGSELISARLSFAGYTEGLPAPGSLVCTQGDYARKHVPWADFPRVPRSASLPFARFPVRNFGRLPAVSFVIPNLCHDMHDCSVSAGDAWLRTHIGAYARWAMRHSSLLILTWDEDDGNQSNHIATIFVGQRVAPGVYRQRITHYNVLRTIDQAYGLRPIGRAASAAPILAIWRRKPS
jgi:acid phosphatase